MLFYVLVAMLMARNEAGVAKIVPAWILVIGCIAHTIVQTQTDNVALRGRVFIITYAALSLMWLLFLSRALGIVA